MLPRSRKVNTTLFKKVLKNGRSYGFKYFSVKLMNNFTNEPKNRFTCVVSKKVVKKATLRNLFRRRFFSIIQEVDKATSPFLIMIFFLKKGGEELSFNDLRKEILSIFKEINNKK